MEREHRSQRHGTGVASGRGSELSVGKRSSSGSASGLGAGTGFGAAEPVRQEPDQIHAENIASGTGHGSVPRMDLAGAGTGFGITDVFTGIGDAVAAGVGAVVDALGAPIITHKTFDAAPSAPETRTTVGVGETVEFNSNVDGKWKVDNGAKSLPKTGSGNKFLWGAMSTAGTAKITFTAKPDPKAKTPAPSPVDVVMTVLAPTVDYLNPVSSFSGSGAGVQMTTNVTFLPGTVSFANTMWWEQPGPATGATGYFDDHVKVRHHQLPFHHPAANDLQIDATNSGITDDAGFSDFNGPFKDGFFEWVIPTFYKLTDEATRHKIIDIHQTCNITADGTMTVHKGTASLSRAAT